MAVNHEIVYGLPSGLEGCYTFFDEQDSGNAGDNNQNGSGNNDPNAPNQSGTGNDQSGQTDNRDAEWTELKKEVQGLRTLMGKQSNEVGNVRELKNELAELKKLIPQGGGAADSDSDNQSGNSGNEKPPELTAEDEKNLNEHWKNLSSEQRERMINEASGSTRKEKIDNVRTEFSRVYSNEAAPVPDELFPTSAEANQSGRNKRAGNTLGSIVRESLGLKEAEHRTGVPPGSRPSGGSRQTTQAGNQPQSRRGQTSGGLTGLGSNNK